MVFCFTTITFSCMPDFHCKYLLWLKYWSVVLNQKYDLFKTVSDWIPTSSPGPSFLPLSYRSSVGPFAALLMSIVFITIAFCFPSPELSVQMVNSFVFLARCLEGHLKWVSHIKWLMGDTLDSAKVVFAF